MNRLPTELHKSASILHVENLRLVLRPGDIQKLYNHLLYGNHTVRIWRMSMIKINPLDQERSEFKDNDLVCYCFQYTRKQIEEDYLENGRSMILEKIAHEKKIGGCDCAHKNPRRR